ncbi:hypothetical protein KRP22_009535 [Phytophthora ramorum]|nr:Polyubiquitin [Phytophthora ramorum]
MSAFVLPVPWRDAKEQGLKGVVEVHSFDFPKETITRVGDLKTIVNKKIREMTPNKSVVRGVNRIMLHGVRVSNSSRLEYLVPELMSSSPRLVATTSRIRGTYMTVFVDFFYGRTAAVQCTSTDTVAYIKARIEDKEGIPPEDQRLVFAGKRLQDDCTLSFYNIGNADTLHSMGRILGGSTGGFATPQTFADVSDGSIITAVDFSDRAPEWRVCSKGLNIEGRCENRACPAFRHMAIHRKKFELFNLILDDNVHCPLCRWRMKPVTCGLYDCCWRFEGVKADDEISVCSRYQDAEGYVYYRFDADENKNSIEWSSLLIVVKPRDELMVAKLLLPPDSVGVSMDDMCAICWSPFGSPRKRSISKTHCGHHFHGICLGEWAAWCKKACTQPSCPICRRTV